MPDPAVYLAVMPHLARAFRGNGFAHGAAHLVDGGCAAAMWLPHIPLYERHGFVVLGAIQAGSSPTMVPMRREPGR